MPIRPTGTLTTNTARQSTTASSPPISRPRNEPAIAATWLIPSAMPRRSGGNASVRIADELANSIAPPTPWTSRQPISHRAPASPDQGTRASAIEPTVNTTKPRL